jgi:hypothetical protein
MSYGPAWKGGGSKGGKNYTLEVQCAQPKALCINTYWKENPRQALYWYRCLQGIQDDTTSSSGNSARGVAIFTRKDIEVIPESVYGSPSGHFAIECNDFHGSRVVIGRIYGVSAGSDSASMKIFEELLSRPLL